MHPLVSLAKSAVENYIKNGKIISTPENLGGEFSIKRAGTFVTITENNAASLGEPRQGRELRGCIGTYLPIRKNIAEEVIYNAIAAATEDYRFGIIQKEELPHLSYTVCILSGPEPVKDLKELNHKKYGIIVKASAKTGLLLPDLEGVNTVEQQISIACQKAGIDPNKEKIIIYKFTVEKFN